MSSERVSPDTLFSTDSRFPAHSMAKASSLAEVFAAARKAFAAGDLPVATTGFIQCVMADPANLSYLDALLAAWTAIHGPPKPTRTPAKPLGEALEKALSEQRWNDLLTGLPRRLADSPWQARLLAIMSTACEGAGADDVAWRWLETAMACAGNDLKALRTAAKTYEKLQAPSDAMTLWRRIHAALPADDEAAAASARLTVLVARRRGGLEVDLPPPAKLKVEAANKAAQQAAQEHVDVDQTDERGLTPVQRLERLIRDQPGVPEHYLKIVPLYLRLARDHDAERMLSRAREATGKDPRVVEQWEELVIRRLARKVEAAEKQHAKLRSPDSQTALEEATLERDRFETDIFLARSKRDPQRTAVRFELARRFKRAGDIDDALPHLQAAMADPELQAEAAWELGDVARLREDFAEAAKMFRRSAELARRPEQWSVKRRALCDAGRLAIDAKMARVARRYADQVLQGDPADADALALRRAAAAIRF